MTTGTIKSQGTKLYFAFPAESSSTPSILRVACPTGISGLGGAANQIDVSCLDSVEMEYVRGMKNPGQITIPINFIARSEAHQALLDLSESGETISWMAVLSDQTSAPTTVDSDDRLVSPGATNVEFQAYVADASFDIPINDIVRATLTLQRSGPPRWTLPTADLP